MTSAVTSGAEKAGAAAAGKAAARKAAREGGKAVAQKAGRTAVEKGSAAVAARTSKTDAGGKPSVAGHVAKGTAAGAATGAVLGSVVPGIGTAIGAGAGAVAGAVGGGVSGERAKGRYRRQNRTPATRILVAEFVVAFIVLALSPLTDKHRSDTPGQYMKRATGVCALFVILGLVGSIGPKSGKAAAAFGGLVLLVLLLSDRDILAVIAKRFNGPTPVGPAGPGLPDGSEGDISQGVDTTPLPSTGQAQQQLPRPRG